MKPRMDISKEKTMTEFIKDALHNFDVSRELIDDVFQSSLISGEEGEVRGGLGCRSRW